MNICLVSREYPPETGWGGIGTYTYNLAHGLAGLGHEVHVISYAASDERSYRDEGIYIHRIRERRVRGLWRLEKYFPISVLLYSIRVSQKIDELIKRYDIKIVEFPNWYAEGFWFMLKAKKIPAVTRLHTPYFEILKIENKQASLNDIIRCWLEKRAAIKSGILLSSTFAHREFMAKEYRIPKEKIKVIPLGIDISRYQNKKTDMSHNGHFNILYVSRLEERKGIKVLLSVVPKIVDIYPNAHIFLIGKDADNRYQAAFRKEHGGVYLSNVHFLGYVDQEELDKHYRACDLFVVPSLYESFGLVYLEAMKYGKPVIGCRVGGIPEIIEDGKTGILVSCNDPASLFDKMRYFIEDESLRREIGKNAFTRVRSHFNVDKMALETSGLYLQTKNEASAN